MVSKLHFHKVVQNKSAKCGTGSGGGCVKPQKGQGGGSGRSWMLGNE